MYSHYFALLMKCNFKIPPGPFLLKLLTTAHLINTNSKCYMDYLSSRNNK